MSRLSRLSPGVGGSEFFISRERECSIPPLGDMRDMRDIWGGLSTGWDISGLWITVVTFGDMRDICSGDKGDI